MLERPRQPQQRSRPSSSKGSEAALRKLDWPRPEGFCLSGKIIILKFFSHPPHGPALNRVFAISDGIARVHGLANVQAEELVE